MANIKGVIILAGGRSSRLGKVNKAFIDLDGKPLIQHIIVRVTKVSPNIIVVGQKNIDEWKFNETPLANVSFAEDAYESKGPLAGIIGGIRNLRTRYVAVIPCDTPFINPKVVELLFREVKKFDAAIPLWPNDNIEPLQAVYKSTVTIRAAEDALRNDELSILAMIKRLRKINYVPIEKIRKINPSLDTFFNINTNSDLEDARERILTTLRK